MADQIKKLSAGHSIEVLDAIMTEVEEARGEYESLDARLDEISGEGYSKAEVDALLALKQNVLTTSQLAAANSGIDSAKVAQIEMNKNNILTDEAALIELVNSGAKNHINNMLTSGTTPSGGISYTVNSDSSITITGGTATANADIVIPFSVNNSGTYVLTGGAAGGSGVTYKSQITLYPSMSGVVEIFDDISAETTLTAGTDYAFRFRVYSGKTIPDCTIYPMICTKAAWDISQTYQPYRPSYQELYEMVKALQAQLANQ